MLVAILLAVIGVLCGMAPYFALAGILSGLIQNTLTAERIFCYVGIAVLGETLKMLFNTVSSLKAHRVAYHILGNIRCKLAEKMMRVPMGVMVDTPTALSSHVARDHSKCFHTALHYYFTFHFGLAYGTGLYDCDSYWRFTLNGANERL